MQLIKNQLISNTWFVRTRKRELTVFKNLRIGILRTGCSQNFENWHIENRLIKKKIDTLVWHINFRENKKWKPNPFINCFYDNRIQRAS